MKNSTQETSERINRYSCGECHASVVTRDVDEGVTPFMIACVSCDGMMQSAFYQPRGYVQDPTYEWYKPDASEMRTLDRDTLQHVAMGGLLKRKIEVA